MNNTLDLVLKRYEIDINEKSHAKINIRRHELGHLIAFLGFSVGAEIGVDRGIFSKILCETYPGLKLYCIDPWLFYDGYTDIGDQAQLDANYAETVVKLKDFNCEVIRKTSTEAVKDFASRSLDFVYIDGNHDFEHVTEDIENWSKVVKIGGIISGHDYRTSPTSHGKWSVARAVQNYVFKKKIKKLFLLTKYFDSSWFFINE